LTALQYDEAWAWAAVVVGGREAAGDVEWA
jgi:hypothetical protein